MNEIELRAPTFAEQVAIDNYRAAVQGALASADGTGDKLATAAVSVATAYGAVIALVAPKDSPAPLVVALPFIAFAIALVLGLWAQSLGIGAKPDDALSTVQASVTQLIERKRRLNRIALVALGIGLALAGAIVADTYRKPADSSSARAAVVFLTPAGQAGVEVACGRALERVAGKVDASALGEAWVTVERPEGCPLASGVLQLPSDAVVSVRVDA